MLIDQIFHLEEACAATAGPSKAQLFVLEPDAQPGSPAKRIPLSCALPQVFPVLMVINKPSSPFCRRRSTG